jgi:hypothetical protein
MKKETFTLEIKHDSLVDIKIPICKYHYENYKDLDTDLKNIIDNLEIFFEKRNFKNPTSRFYVSEESSATGVLSTCHRLYNILDSNHLPSITNFRKFIYGCISDYNQIAYNSASDELFVKCWGNKHLPNDRTTVHNHIDRLRVPGIAGHYNFLLDENRTATRYMLPIDKDFREWSEETLSIKNTNGALVLFPRFLFHDTTNNRNQQINRYSLGFTISKIKDDFDLYNHCWVAVKDL